MINNYISIRRQKLIICLFLVIATLTVYWQMNYHEFINFDDSSYILQNQHVQKGLTLESIFWAFSFTDIAYWHPLTWLSHMLDCQIYGLTPCMHHRTNLIFHIANSILLFFVLQKMTGTLWKSAFVAALFALHPINVESVAWVAERKNLLSTFFWMLTMLAYVHYTRHPNLYRYLLTFLLLMFGLMAKPMLVTLPFVLLLLDYWPLGRLQQQSVFNLILEKIPFFALSIVSAYISTLSVQHYKIVVSTELVPMKLRIANALVSYISYIKKMVWPDNLAIFYPYPDTLPLWQVTVAGLILIGISILVLWMLKSKPYLATGWFWYIGTFVPVIGLKQAGLWPAMADRWAYIPLIGLFILLSWGAGDIASKLRYKKILPAVIAVILLIFTITTWMQVRYWSSSVALFKHSIDVTNDNDVAHQKLGEALAAQGKTDEAIRHYYEALRIKPDLVAAHLNLGVALREEGKINEAVEHFSMALRAKPDCAEAYYELGVTLEKQGNFDAAVRHYSEALRIKPEFVKGHNNLGNAMARQGNFEGAVYHYNEALKINPNYAGAHYNLGKIAANQGKIEDAILHYKKTLQVSPNMAEALYNLSWIYVTNEKFRNSEKAVNLAEKLCRLQNYNQPLSLNVLAAAYAEAGKFDKAVLTAQKGLELAQKMGPKELSISLENRLKLYQAGRPYRQTRPEKGNN